MESIKVEKGLTTISHHLRNEESKSSALEKNGKKNKETLSNVKDIVILQLQNEIMSLKKSKGVGKKPIKKNTNKNTSS